MSIRKYFVIFNETKDSYWNRITKKFKGIEHATEYEGGSVDGLEQIIMNDVDIKKNVGCYSVKTIIRIEKE